MVKSIKTNRVKVQSWSELAIVIGILVFINLIGAAYFVRVDLTAEKRYSLSKASKELAGKLDDVLFVKVYLEGEFPAGFKRLSRSTKEMREMFIENQSIKNIKNRFDLLVTDFKLKNNL
jgi:hypothetical protein